MVGKTGADLAQFGDQVLDHTHADVESSSESRHKPNPPHAVRPVTKLTTCGKSDSGPHTLCPRRASHQIKSERDSIAL